MGLKSLLLAEATMRQMFEFGRIQSEIDWLLPAAVFLAIFIFVVVMYRRDTVELGRGLSVLLISLRMAAFLGLVAFYLQPQWRNQRQIVHNSRALVLVDTSLSMETDDNDASPGEPNRAQKVAAFLADNKFIGELRKVHDVIVLRFDRDLSRVVSLTRLPPAAGAAKVSATPSPDVNWPEALAPRGTETRLGETLRQLINEEQSGPVSAIVLVTDGQQNAGLEPALAAEAAREAGIPIFPIGIGSAKPPVNVRISDFVAPVRAYPGDAYTVTAYLQAQGLAGKSVNVEVLSRAADQGSGPKAPAATREATEQVTLGADGEATPVLFKLHPEQVGRRTLTLRVDAPPEDRNRDDNRREFSVEIVDHKTQVLLFAGGPSREYQFLRNQLRRDKDVVVDVLLQSGSEGISQDACEILDEFPRTRQELFDYDCIVAFDPDWRELDAAQVDLVERWVGEEAGGLIVVAGPIYTDAWSQEPALAKIRTLYPVEFNRRFAVVEDAHFGSPDPWPLEWTRAGLDAPFFWLADTASASADDWSSFKGVYGYYAVRGEKHGAEVYARFSDPRTAVGDQLPVYFAGQSYGSGHVFYFGSGEMWRLRRLSDAYFETFYTKLIRHVSQGRLLRGSNRGILQTARNQYLPGNTVDVNAQVTNAQLEPLTLAQVPLHVILPDGNLQSVVLKADPSRAGSYRGQFTVRKEGSYRLELPLPDGKDERLTTTPIQVTIPNLERDHVQRNDTLLAELARRTGGKYYIGLDAAQGLKPAGQPLSAELRDQTRTLTVSAAPEQFFNDAAPWHRARWMLAGICGVLCLEWLVRRLAKLA